MASYQQATTEQPQRQQGATELYRAPTWARNIDFGGNDLDVGGSTPAASATASPLSAVGTPSRDPSSLPNVDMQDGASSSRSSPRTSLVTKARPISHTVGGAAPGQHSPHPSVNGFVAGHIRGASKGSLASSRMSTPDGINVATPISESTPKAAQLAAGATQAFGYSNAGPPSKSILASASFLPSNDSRASSPYFGSSADAYAHQTNQASSSSYAPQPRFQDFARAEDAASMDHPGQDGSHHTHATGESGFNPNKRTSVLSFQTALSGPSNARSTDGLGLHQGGSHSRSANGRGGEHVEYMSNQRERFSHPAALPSDSSTGAVWSAGASEPRRQTISPRLKKADLPNSQRLDTPDGSNPRSSRLSGRSVGAPSRGLNPSVPSVASDPSRATASAADSAHRVSQLRDYEDRAAGSRPPTRSDDIGERSPALDRNKTLRPLDGRGNLVQSMGDVRERSSTHAKELSDPDAKNAAASEHVVEYDEAVSKPPQPPEKSGMPSPPPLPEKESPLVPIAHPVPGNNHRLSSFAADSMPPMLPVSLATATPIVAPINPQAPVSDFRKKPLVDVTPELQAAGRASLQQQRRMTGLGAHDMAHSFDTVGQAPRDETSSSTGVEARRKSVQSLGLGLPRAALVEAPSGAEAVGRTSLSSAETPSREPSPPPEGEVEARAEWERSRMKQKQKKDRHSDAATAAAGRKTTLRGQLRPLHLVAEDLPGGRRNSGLDAALASASPTIATQQRPGGTGTGTGGGNVSSGGGGGGSAAISTQQLQRQQARDQRRSVGAINMAMVGGADLASGSNGPYPVFTSPSAVAASGVGAASGRLYSGMTAQRSLVAPFELQQRPDGLLSGLIGPDGVRRSVNDPEVCLECMMRDEDMIDVHVVGSGLWERESDRDFEDALRQEQEDDARRASEREHSRTGGSTAGEDLNGSLTGHSASQHGSLREGHTNSRPKTKIRVKRVGQHDDLTAERLKLHTQLNPPASSHRWRTLQYFLSVQAKYIALEQRARREDPDRYNTAESRSVPVATRDRAVSAAMAQRASSEALPAPPGTSLDKNRNASGSGNRKSITKNRSTSALQLGRSGPQLVADEDLRYEELATKERDVAGAREARRKNASAISEGATSGLGVGSLSRDGYTHKQGAVNQGHPGPLTIQTSALDDSQQRRFSSSPVTVTNVGAFPTPRRPTAAGSSSRGASASDLRSVPGAMLSSPAMPSTPDSLAPPSAMMYASTPKGFGGRTASQLSLAPSGSMLDMHLALAGTSAENRAGLALPLPMPSPMDLERAGSSSPRNFFGFPGDGDAQIADPSYAAGRAEPRAAGTLAGLGDLSVDRSGPGTGSALPFGKKKSRGLRGFFSKMSGGGSGHSNGNRTENRDDSSKRSSSSGSPRMRRGSMSADSSLAPPPGLSGLISRARRSTSSLVGGRDSMEHVRDVYSMEPPGMSSPDRFDMGPFQAPLPPERKQSRLVPEESRATHGPVSASSGLRPSSSSSGNFLAAPDRYAGQNRTGSTQGFAPANGPRGNLASTTADSSGRVSPASNRSMPLAGGQHRKASNKLPTIDASPGMPTQSLDGSSRATTQTGGSKAADSVSVRSHKSASTSTSVRHRSESRTSMADTRSSRFSMLSKPVYDSLPARQSAQLQQPGRSMPVAQNTAPGRPSLNLAPLRPARSPRRPDVSASSHSTTLAPADHQQHPQQHHLQQQQGFVASPTSSRRMSMATPPASASGRGFPDAFSTSYLDTETQGRKTGKDRKSKLLRIPFGLGKNKNRSSSILSPMSPPHDNEKVSEEPLRQAPAPEAPEQEERYQPRPSFQIGAGLRSLSAPFETRSLRSRASTTFVPAIPTSGMGPFDAPDDVEEHMEPRPASRARKSMNLFERPRAFSSAAAADLPPRSESVFGKLPLTGFVKSRKRS
ncbi:unnamed protein product [Parajaminaea phylloscopi]